MLTIFFNVPANTHKNSILGGNDYQLHQIWYKYIHIHKANILTNNWGFILKINIKQTKCLGAVYPDFWRCIYKVNHKEKNRCPYFGSSLFWEKGTVFSSHLFFHLFLKVEYCSKCERAIFIVLSYKQINVQVPLYSAPSMAKYIV